MKYPIQGVIGAGLLLSLAFSLPELPDSQAVPVTQLQTDPFAACGNPTLVGLSRTIGVIGLTCGQATRP